MRPLSIAAALAGALRAARVCGSGSPTSAADLLLGPAIALTVVDLAFTTYRGGRSLFAHARGPAELAHADPGGRGAGGELLLLLLALLLAAGPLHVSAAAGTGIADQSAGLQLSIRTDHRGAFLALGAPLVRGLPGASGGLRWLRGDGDGLLLSLQGAVQGGDGISTPTGRPMTAARAIAGCGLALPIASDAVRSFSISPPARWFMT